MHLKIIESMISALIHPSHLQMLCRPEYTLCCSAWFYTGREETSSIPVARLDDVLCCLSILTNMISGSSAKDSYFVFEESHGSQEEEVDDKV